LRAIHEHRLNFAHGFRHDAVRHYSGESSHMKEAPYLSMPVLKGAICSKTLRTPDHHSVESPSAAIHATAGRLRDICWMTEGMAFAQKMNLSLRCFNRETREGRFMARCLTKLRMNADERQSFSCLAMTPKNWTTGRRTHPYRII
jgi:hypothetical protein